MVLECLAYIFFSDEAKAWQSILLGATARTFSGIATLPVTVVKTRYEVCHMFVAFLSTGWVFFLILYLCSLKH